MGEEDAGGEYEEGTKEKKRKRPSKRDLVCTNFHCCLDISFFCYRICLKNKRASRNLLKHHGCILEHLFIDRKSVV